MTRKLKMKEPLGNSTVRTWEMDLDIVNSYCKALYCSIAR